MFFSLSDMYLVTTVLGAATLVLVPCATECWSALDEFEKYGLERAYYPWENVDVARLVCNKSLEHQCKSLAEDCTVWILEAFRYISCLL